MRLYCSELKKASGTIINIDRVNTAYKSLSKSTKQEIVSRKSAEFNIPKKALNIKDNGNLNITTKGTSRSEPRNA